MNVNYQQLIRYASVVPGQTLREVRELPEFDSWAIDYHPDCRPTVLFIGENSAIFGCPCWPFMAAHEATHTIATEYYYESEYKYFLYNVFEDARNNHGLLEKFSQLRDSYQASQRAILTRWQQRPIKLRSPYSIVLQYLCFLNHKTVTKPPEEVNPGLLKQLLDIRAEFLLAQNQPLLEEGEYPIQENKRRTMKLIELIRRHRAPHDINVGEIRHLLQQNGWLAPQELQVVQEMD